MVEYEILNAICNSLLVTALFVVLKAIVEDSVSTTTAWIAFIIMTVSIVGKIVTQYFSQLQRTHAGYFMVADKRINIGEKLKSVPMGYFNQNSLLMKPKSLACKLFRLTINILGDKLQPHISLLPQGH